MNQSMNQFIPITKPWITDEDIAAVNHVLKSGMLVQGEKVKALEQHVSTYLNGAEVIAVSNGTATMHMMLQLYGIGAGDEVIIPAFSYVATANVVELNGATPVFVDTEALTFNIDPQGIETKITPKTKAILAVHEFGLSADADAIKAICKKHNLLFLEDAACALGAEYKGIRTGCLGDTASFSLHPRKAITSGEGGLIVTRDKALAERCRIMRNHGIDPAKGHTGFVAAGYNYRMTDFQAALVLSQFGRFDAIMQRKQEIAQQYISGIKNPKLTVPVPAEGYYHSWQSFHLILNGISQNDAIAYLKDKGIGANYGAQCIPHMDFYREKYSTDSINQYPNAWNAWKNGLVIPLYPQMEASEIQHIINTLNNI